METTQSPALTATIDVKSMSFADWQLIASACDNSDKWGFYKWLETSDKVSELKLDDWEAIAGELGYSGNWAYKQYSEHRG